jgi:hypothetical protein
MHVAEVLLAPVVVDHFHVVGVLLPLHVDKVHLTSLLEALSNTLLDWLVSRLLS